MSVVTNTILSYDSARADNFLQQVNAFFQGKRGFVSVEDASLPEHWYGGGKNLEVSLAIGAFNHLDLDGLIEHICQLEHNDPDYTEIQLMVREQEDELFRLINIADEIRRRLQQS